MSSSRDALTLFGFATINESYTDDDGYAISESRSAPKSQTLLDCPQPIALGDSTSHYSIHGGGHKGQETLANYQWTIGDLNSNTLKLIDFLGQIGVWAISAEDHATIKRIVDNGIDIPDVELKKAVDDVKRILQKATFNRVAMVRLIGDEIADRGDPYTLLVLDKLVDASIPVEIVASNHGMLGLKAYENEVKADASLSVDHKHAADTKTAEAKKAVEQQNSSQNRLGKTPANLPLPCFQSLYRLQQLISRGIFDVNEVKKMFGRVYGTHLRAIAYSKGPESLAIFTHARAGLNAIWQLADLFYIDYQQKTLDDLLYCIDNINDIVLQLARANMLTALQNLPAFSAVFSLFIENREKVDLSDCPSFLDDHALYFFHGHFAHQKTVGNVYNLDEANTLGRTLDAKDQAGVSLLLGTLGHEVGLPKTHPNAVSDFKDGFAGVKQEIAKLQDYVSRELPKGKEQEDAQKIVEELLEKTNRFLAIEKPTPIQFRLFDADFKSTLQSENAKKLAKHRHPIFNFFANLVATLLFVPIVIQLAHSKYTTNEYRFFYHATGRQTHLDHIGSSQHDHAKTKFAPSRRQRVGPG